MNYTIIILGVIVMILLFIVYMYFLSPATSLAQQASLNNNGNTTQQLTMPASATSLNYSYNIWVCVNKWSTISNKTIFFRPTSIPAAKAVDPLAVSPATASAATVFPLQGATATNTPQIILYLDKTTPTLYCYIQQTAGGTPIGPIPITTNFPIQSWVYVSISVQNTYVDLYLQGKLVKSIQLTAQPTTPGDNTVPTILGGSVDANVAAFKYYPNSLTPQQVWTNYMAGNGQNPLSSLSSYGVNVGVTSNGATQSTYTLF